jgi:hypothetical protein
MIKQLSNNLFYILSGTLLFLVLSSKNILIYNEELLIAASFIAFVVTSAHTGKEAIAETFQTRAKHIQDELEAFFVSKETLCHEVKHNVQMQKKLAQSILALGALVVINVEAIHTQRAVALRHAIHSQTLAQLQQMIAQQHAVQGHLHNVTCASYKHVMLEAMQMQKQTMQSLCMQNALDLLGTMQRKSTGQSTNTKTRKLVKVQATSSKSEAKLKKTPAAKTKKKA